MKIVSNEIFSLKKNLKFKGVEDENQNNSSVATLDPQEEEQKQEEMNAYSRSMMNNNIAFQGGMANSLKKMGMGTLLALATFAGTSSLSSCKVEGTDDPKEINIKNEVNVKVDMEWASALLNKIDALMGKIDGLTAEIKDGFSSLRSLMVDIINGNDANADRIFKALSENTNAIKALAIIAKDNGQTQANIEAQIKDLVRRYENNEGDKKALFAELKALLGDFKAMFQDYINMFKTYAETSTKQREENNKLAAQILKSSYVSNYQLNQLIKGQAIQTQAINKQTAAINGLQAGIENAINNQTLSINANIQQVADALGVKVDDLTEVLKATGKSLGEIMTWNAGQIKSELAKINNNIKAGNKMTAQILRYAAIIPQLKNAGMITATQATNIANMLSNLNVEDYTEESLAALKTIVSQLGTVIKEVRNLRKDMNINFAYVKAELRLGNKLSAEGNKKLDTANKQNEVLIAEVKNLSGLVKESNGNINTLVQLAEAAGMDIDEIKDMMKLMGQNTVDVDKIINAMKYHADIQANLTIEQTNEIKKLAGQNLTLIEIAQKSGISLDDIEILLEKLGVTVDVLTEQSEIDHGKLEAAADKITNALEGLPEFLKKIAENTEAIKNGNANAFAKFGANLDEIIALMKDNKAILGSQENIQLLILNAMQAFKAEESQDHKDILDKLDKIANKASSGCNCKCDTSEILIVIKKIYDKMQNHEGILDDLEDLDQKLG